MPLHYTHTHIMYDFEILRLLEKEKTKRNLLRAFIPDARSAQALASEGLLV